MKLGILFTLFLSTICLAGVPGNEHGNGGDPVAAEFVKTGRWLALALSQMGPRDLGAIDPMKFEDAVLKTQVNSADHVLLSGIEVDAINYPNEHRILVNRPRWDELDKDFSIDKQRRLALHEYLWIAGYDDSNYKISNHLFDAWQRTRANGSSRALNEAVCWAAYDLDNDALIALATVNANFNVACQFSGTSCKTPLGCALSRYSEGNDHLDTIKILLGAGANPNQPLGDMFCDFSLSRAVGSNDFTLVRILLKAGASPNNRETLDGSSEKATPLYSYISYKDPGFKYDPRIVEALLAAGENPNLSDSDHCDETILMEAVRLKNDDVVNYFSREMPSKVNWCHTNHSKLTVLDLALAHAPNYVTALQKAGAKRAKDCGVPPHPTEDPYGVWKCCE